MEENIQDRNALKRNQDIRDKYNSKQKYIYPKMNFIFGGKNVYWEANRCIWRKYICMQNFGGKINFEAKIYQVAKSYLEVKSYLGAKNHFEGRI